MGKLNEQLADALRALTRLLGKYNGVIESEDLKEAHRVILVVEGFLWQVQFHSVIKKNSSEKSGLRGLIPSSCSQ